MRRRNLGGQTIRRSRCPYCDFETEGTVSRSNLILKMHIKYCKYVPDEIRSEMVKSVESAPAIQSKIRNEFGLNSITTTHKLSSIGNKTISPDNSSMQSGNLDNNIQTMRNGIMDGFIKHIADTTDTIPKGPASKQEVFKSIFQIKQNNPELYKKMRELSEKISPQMLTSHNSSEIVDNIHSNSPDLFQEFARTSGEMINWMSDSGNLPDSLSSNKFIKDYKSNFSNKFIESNDSDKLSELTDLTELSKFTNSIKLNESNESTESTETSDSINEIIVGSKHKKKKKNKSNKKRK